MNRDYDPLSGGSTRREQLTGMQRRVLDHMLLRTYEIAVQEAEIEFNNPEDYAARQFERRPRHVFYIDGARGSGKTTLLLAAREHLQYLGCGDELEDRPRIPPHIEDAYVAIRNDNCFANEGPEFSKPLQAGKLFRSPHQSPKGRPKRTTLVFPVLFPSDLDNAQPIMEGLFAFMDGQLAIEIENAGNISKAYHQPLKEERVRAGRELQRRLHRDVTKSWFLSKQEGIEAILRDSHNYDKFLENRGRASGQSYRRVHDWRQFVNEYLDYFGAQMLAIFIDDTDVIPESSTDILHTLRIFLDHPRIVTAVAGNLRTLRQSLVWLAMSRMRRSMGALSSRAGSTALEWRQFLRHQIEEYLDKVVPRPQRQFLSLRTPLGNNPEGDSDLERFLSPAKSLAEYCNHRMDVWLHRFFQTKIETNNRWHDGKREIGDAKEHAQLEHLLSWWLFRHWYLEKLGPRTPRELKTLVHYTCHDENAKHSIFRRNKNWHEKRLAVILFENSENHELVHRFGDGDWRVTEWLSRQELSSEWIGNRSFYINGRKIPEGTYSYNYICYRLDLGMALPLRENMESEIPKPLLPRPAGRNLNDRPPFFPIDWQPKTARMIDAFNHSVMPTNCTSMYDLECLPDVAWRRKDTDDPWRPNLIYKWPVAFDLLAPRLATRGAKNADQQRRIEDYFFDVVIPMATLDIGRFVPVQRSPRNAKKYTKENLLLWHETDKDEKGKPSNFFEEDREWLDDLRRRIDYLSAKETALNAGEMRQIHEKSLAADLKTFVEASRLKNQVGALKHLVEYQWLLNDVRRAWHAARIFINHTGELIEHDTEPDKLPPNSIRRHFFSRSDRYRVVSLVSLIDEINRLPPFREFWSNATVDVGDYAAEVKEEHSVCWKHVRPARFIDMLVASASQPDGLGTAPKVSEAAQSGLLNPKNTEGSPFLFTGHEEGHRNARLARVLFFLAVGLGPCLPAMIHIDVAGALYAKRGARERVEHWRKELERLQIFCFRYRASLERFLLRGECLADRPEHEFKKHIKGTSLPDWSFSSLGVEGRRGMQRRDWGELANRMDLIELLTGSPSLPDKEDERSESSLFRDAEAFLNNAQRFLSLIEEVVNARKVEAFHPPPQTAAVGQTKGDAPSLPKKSRKRKLSP